MPLLILDGVLQRLCLQPFGFDQGIIGRCHPKQRIKVGLALLCGGSFRQQKTKEHTCKQADLSNR